MIRRAALFLATGSFCVAAGCSGGKSGGGVDNDPPKHVSVGGSVVTRIDDLFVGLPGVAVTLTPAEGDGIALVTSSTGLFEFGNVREGVYFFEASLAGYDTVQLPVSVDAAESAFGILADDDDAGSTPSYTFLGSVPLREVSPVASISPFGIEVRRNETLVDGTAGLVMIYDKSSDGDIVVTFDRAIGLGSPVLRDVTTNQLVFPFASAGRTVFTFAEADLDALNGATGLTEGPAHTITFSNLSTITPINGENDPFSAAVHFRATP